MSLAPTVKQPVIVVVAAGPGVSGSVARLFAEHGYRVGLVGRSRTTVHELAAGIATDEEQVRPEVVDVTDVEAATAAVTRLGEAFGRIDVLHFNPSAYRPKNPLSLSVDELLSDVALGVGALLTSVQAARPFMSSGARITVTGSMAADRPSPAAASLGVQKAGVRNLVQSLDAQLRPEGIRAVSVTVRGTLAAAGPFTPDRVAQAIFAAAAQDPDAWRAEIPYEG
ncbi:SDR family oxidoreductase [Aeromicrobium chenweiae]|uniref:Short-chain dehydrogenase n=1 Tax=Aeromicrobium chenweiae TaxID=2079793 RepID=A0A2S0WLU6_9ACTN|nr:SDR family oxidoreductase [Aeromicrobium chenweiae]AWB92287.1 short-chain dehydrogenase [Aeromicrobium chenweiae]TGN31429.1 SDR family oxidoreductase [Aeromicrobium chenweiae]